MSGIATEPAQSPSCDAPDGLITIEEACRRATAYATVIQEYGGVLLGEARGRTLAKPVLPLPLFGEHEVLWGGQCEGPVRRLQQARSVAVQYRVRHRCPTIPSALSNWRKGPLEGLDQNPRNKRTKP